MNSGLPASAAPLGGVGIPCVKVKFCRYYAKDKTCFYGDECQFLHEEPSMASMSLHSGASPVPLSMSGGAVTYPLSAPPACPVGVPNVPKKGDSLGPAGTALEGQMLTSEYTSSVCTRPIRQGLAQPHRWLLLFGRVRGFVNIEPGDSLRPLSPPKQRGLNMFFKHN